jgi:hypothetical protein
VHDSAISPHVFARHCPIAIVPVNGAGTVAGHLARPPAAGPVAQWLEPAAHNGLVAGSSPAGPTTLRPDGLRVAQPRQSVRANRVRRRLGIAKTERKRDASGE